jgi:hypothetical protein
LQSVSRSVVIRRPVAFVLAGHNGRRPGQRKRMSLIIKVFQFKVLS